METNLLATLGRVAGLAGIAIGLSLLIFKDFLKQKFLPSTGLEPAQAYHILLAFLVFVFGVSVIGILSWIIGQTAPPDRPVPFRSLMSLVILALAVLITAIAVGLSDASLKITDQHEMQKIQDTSLAKIPLLGGDRTGGYPLPKSLSLGIGDEVPLDCVIEKYHSLLGPTIKAEDLGLRAYQTMLIPASDAGNYSCVKTIIDKGANVNEGTPLSPLMWAAQNGHENVVLLLLENGANVNLKSPKGFMALDFAISSHSLPTVKALVEHGATMNTPNRYTPLMSAAAAGDLPIVNYMLKKGADACLKDAYGKTAADAAHHMKHKDIEAKLRSTSCPL